MKENKKARKKVSKKERKAGRQTGSFGTVVLFGLLEYLLGLTVLSCI